MKKLKSLLGAIVVFAAAFAVLPSQAQIKTYFHEDFTQSAHPGYPGLNPDVWNLSACTDVTEEDGPLYFVNTQDGTTWGGWIYDPNGQILDGGVPTPLNGTYEIVSKPITLEADAVNVMQVALMYATSYLGHTFGVRVREQGGEWETVNSGDPYDMDDAFIAVLGSKWSGKTVEVEIVFTTVLQQGYPYYCLMSDISFLAYANDPIVATELLSAPFAQGENMDLILRISNAAPVAVSSVEYTYSIDDAAEKTLSFSINPSIGMTESVRVTDQISMEGLSYGNHTLKIRENKVNGEAYEGDVTEIEFLYVDESTLTQTYVPVFESFTSSTCSPCRSANAALNPVQEELRNAGILNVIKYQMDWPGDGDKYYIAGNRTRMEFYDGVFGWGGKWSVPVPVYNGLDIITDWPANYWSELADMVKTKATVDHQRKAMMDIHITNASIDDSKKLTLEFEITPKVTTKGNVIAVIAEGTTTGNRGSNGEKEFHHVALAFSANGLVKEFEADKTETFKYTTYMSRTHMEEVEDLEVLCFVQHESGYIFQSSSIIEGGNVANEEDVLGDIRVYPNPAAENVTIGNLTDANVEMFDIAGRRVYKTEGANGNLQLALTSFAEGTYVVRITENGKTAHRKLVIVR